jgi:hypothetical protein
MNRTLFRLAVFALALCLLPLSGEAREQKKKSPTLEALMKKKLTQAQKVLEGIALQDYDTIGKHAKELVEISKQAEWKVLKTPLYQIYMNEFRLTAEELVANAKKKNVDAAALSYVNMTLTCVKCHKHVREKRMVRADW